MSIVTLKAKAMQKQNVSHNGTFSLNGGRRNTSYIGKTKHSNIYTPYTKYGGPRTYGNYNPNSNVITNKSYTTNDSNIIKKSTLSTNGMLEEQNKWMYRGSDYAGKHDKNQTICGVGPGSIDSSENTTLISKTSEECSENNCDDNEKNDLNDNANLKSTNQYSKVHTQPSYISYPVFINFKNDFNNYWENKYGKLMNTDNVLSLTEIINIWKYDENDEYIFCRIYYKYSGLGNGFDNTRCHFNKQTNRWEYKGLGKKASETDNKLPDDKNYELIFPVNN
jgi:hypothetical protein